MHWICRCRLSWRPRWLHVFVRIYVPHQWSSCKLEKQETNTCCSLHCWSWVHGIGKCNSRQLMADLKVNQAEPTVMFEDNQSSICIVNNPQFHGHAKHINIKLHCFRKKNGSTVTLITWLLTWLRVRRSVGKHSYLNVVFVRHVYVCILSSDQWEVLWA